VAKPYEHCATNLNANDIPLALYVHLPWCERKCPYCDFNSHEQFDSSLETGYIDALLTDLRQQLVSVGSRPLFSVFLGGGTPSLFSGASIARLLSGIDQIWSIGLTTEITMEANPGSAEASRFADYRSAGVNRLSLGIQSFADAQLAALGRVHDSAQAMQAIQLAKQHFDRFNLDIMHGLPGQKIETALDDLERAIDHSHGHVSWYQLTIEPNTTFWSRPPRLPNDDILTDIQDAGEARFQESGLTQYEVSAWASPQQMSQHNLNYWTFGDYIGIGAGAHGKITKENGRVIRTRRSRSPRDYLAGIAEGVQPHQQQLPQTELPVEFMLNALRLKNGVPASLFKAHTGLELAVVKPQVEKLVAKGLLSADTELIGTTDHGYRFLNDVVASFMDNDAR
jgi:putative oxygen-independent coproporphyrinogen III oxidase